MNEKKTVAFRKFTVRLGLMDVSIFHWPG